MAPDLDSSGLRALYDLLTKLTRSQTLEEVYEAGVTSLLQATQAKRASILFFDEDRVMRFKAWSGLSDTYREAVTGHTPWTPGEQGATPLLVPDVQLDESLRPHLPVFAAENIRALAFIPISLDTGVLGKFMLYYSEPHEFTPQEISIAETIASHIALATQRRRAEQACVESEQRLQAILDNAPLAVWVKDRNGRFLLSNQEHRRIIGHDVTGKYNEDAFPSPHADDFATNDARVLEAGRAITFEEVAPQPDGMHTYMSVKFPVRTAEGEVAGVGGMAFDVTERKRNQEASHRLAVIVETSDDAILSHDLSGSITSWNRGAERLYGYSADEAVGKPIWILANPERPDEMPSMIQQLSRGERLEHYETVRRKKDGEFVHVSLTVSPIRNEAGDIIGVSKIARDISDRIHAEQERTQLLENEHRARRRAELLNGIGRTLAAELDLQKLVQAVTDVATLLVGAQFGSFFYNVLDERGASYMLYSLSGAAREDFAKFPMPRSTDVFAATFHGTGPVRSDDITQDPRYGKNSPHQGTPAGHLPVRSYLAVPVISRTGAVLGGLFFGHEEVGKFTVDQEDVLLGLAGQAAVAIDNARLFEREQQIQAELKRSNEGLRQTNRDLEAFAYSASHDLQEPLRNIAIFAQLLEARGSHQTGGPEAGYVQNILRGVRTMEELLRDLLAYTTATKKAEGPPPEIDPGSVLEHVQERLEQSITSTGASIVWNDLPHIYAHEARVAQLFQNLISNALKYRSDDAPVIEISGVLQQGVVVFSVTDNGIGIEPEYAQQIFELFKRLHSRDRYPGSGIGLAICQRIVEQYGGRIWLERSAPGEGSTFCFTFPAEPQK